VGDVRRITVSIPDALLRDAMRVTGKGITETLVEGLRLVRRTRAYEKARVMRGRMRIDVDLRLSRERGRRR
jgi:hypothetical protein